jgi:phosphosulfolactate synthase (CoM biosynthesis protein A)
MTDMNEIVQEANIAFWQEYCDMKIELENAQEEIERLRSALKKIGFDYVEFSHDKVQLLYLEHMSIARKAFMDSFPPDTDKPSYSPLDDNF